MKSKYTPFQIVLEIISAIILLATTVFFLLNWQNIPDKIPSHYDSLGNPDAWNNKSMVAILFAVQLVGFLLITLLSFFPNLWNRPQNLSKQSQPRFYSIVRTLLLEMKTIIVAAFGYLVVATTLARRLNFFIMLLLIAAIVFCIARYLIQTMKLSLADARKALQEEEE